MLVYLVKMLDYIYKKWYRVITKGKRNIFYKLKGEIKMERHEIESTAAALYDGGWRSTDEEELRKEYGFEKSEVAAICEKLAEYQFNEIKDNLTK
jgi:hypothetical protein